MDPTVELGRMVEAGDLEGAFTKALGMSSVETVAWTCGAAEDQREAAFGGSAPALSQGVLLSLAQQLSSDLEDDAPLAAASAAAFAAATFCFAAAADIMGDASGVA